MTSDSAGAWAWLDEVADRLAAWAGSRPVSCGSTRVLAVDGPAGSGKTTVAGAVATRLGGAPVVHLDDVYEGWDDALGPGLAAGIRDGLLRPWAQRRAGRHPVYDWTAGRYEGWREVPASADVVLEGVGSGQRALRPWLSGLVWVVAPGADLAARVVARDGATVARHLDAWAESEAAHFAAEGTEAAADVRVDTVAGVVSWADPTSRQTMWRAADP